MSNKYEHGKIYKICDIAYNMTYYGSTAETLSQRMSRHRSGYRQYKSRNCDKCTSYDIFDKYGIENCKIELVELYPCASKIELKKREGEHIKNNSCVNKIIAGRTSPEWAKDNRNLMNAYNQKYYNSNKAHILDRKKEYREANKDNIHAKQKEYREKNKEQIQARASTPLVCDVCGGRYTLDHKSEHIRARKHQIALEMETDRNDKETHEQMQDQG